ncbi:MAG: two pore domain potassium channel family protein [Acidobacteriaceae bacterium]|nr:two pore domain potassium channel family protein [Acidobacteriaceae bacterium]MBV9766297.1 two pore domain potassium channel family protein [Acidobacteriaceae bacterium]
MRALCIAVAGIFIVGFALLEVFRDLFHPSLTGSLSDFVARSTFRLFRRWPSKLSLAGPLSLVIVILCWVLLLGGGFALIYWSAFPAGFRTFNGQSPDTGTGFQTMLYFSFEALTTLGLGDPLPQANWLRLLATLEALIGFALVTASVSWIVLLYPALGRMRALARRASILARAERNSGVRLVSDGVQYLLGDLALDVIRTRVDFIHFPIIYYFHADHRRSSLAESLRHLMQFAESGAQAEAPDRVRLASATLRAALDDLAAVLADRFVQSDPKDTVAVFRKYAEDHLTSIVAP